MKVVTVPGQTYVVYAADGATITAPGVKDPLLTCEGGKPNYVTVPGGEMEISDPEATYAACRNFKNALAALGLLGGGKNGLPAGYTRLDFLESTGTQYIDTRLKANGAMNVVFSFVLVSESYTNYIFGANGKGDTTGRLEFAPRYGYRGGYGVFRYGESNSGIGTAYKIGIKENYEIVRENVYRNGNKVKYDTTVPQQTFTSKFSILVFGSRNGNNSNVEAEGGKRIYNIAIADEGVTVIDYIPALDSTGTPCMYDLVTRKPFRNDGSGQFIVGMTMEQARKLGKLPSGTTLTVSLPVGYDGDEGVVAALAAAEVNGCVLTLQTYEEGEASTYALRRVWVRKVADENGTCVDADGVRWQVEWCVDVVGADPMELGFERFRSVDAAREYWGLTDYVAPEAEELLTAE